MHTALQSFLSCKLFLDSFSDTVPVLACMDCPMACFAYHQRLPSQTAHSQYPMWHLIASLGVFLLHVLEFSDMVYLKVAPVRRLKSAEFACIGSYTIKNLVPLRYHDFQFPVGRLTCKRQEDSEPRAIGKTEPPPCQSICQDSESCFCKLCRKRKLSPSMSST